MKITIELDQQTLGFILSIVTPFALRLLISL